MSRLNQIVECIPNFSEGVNQNTIEAIKIAIRKVDGVKLLHQDSGKAANRTVFTYAGEVAAVFEATYNAIIIATELIDMRIHKGEHPRIGACDVCPFVPISGITLDELVPHVYNFAKKVSQELMIPIFLYEKSASTSIRKNLEKHRVGGYTALASRISTGKWLPDFGEYNSKTGGTVMGVRNFLVAYNINLNTTDSKIAQEIAYDLRELGRPIGKKNGKTVYKPGKLKKVKAIGWFIKDFNKAQVSINLTDFRATSLYEVYKTTEKLAKVYGLKVTGSELIGLIPKQALIESGEKFSPNSRTEEAKIASSIKELGLNEISPFKPNKRILEYVIKQ